MEAKSKKQKPLKIREHRRKRTSRREIENPHFQKRVLEVLDKISRLHQSTDPEKYAADFLDVWETAASAVDVLADYLLTGDLFDLNDRAIGVMTAPYQLFHLLFFSKLVDRFDIVLEGRFADASKQLDDAWQKFFTFATAHHADMRETLQDMAAAQRIAHDHVTRTFTGEIEAAITPEWVRATFGLESGLKAFAVELMK